MRVDSKTWRLVFERDDGRCRYCGEDLLASPVAFSSAQVDHLISVADGGIDDPENLVLSCATCNGSLSRRTQLHSFDERKIVALAGKQKLISDFNSWLSLRKLPNNIASNGE